MQPMIPPISKRFAIFAPVWDTQEGLDAFIFLQKKNLKGSPALLEGAFLFSFAIVQHVAQKGMARPNDLLQSTYSMYCVLF